MYTYTGYRKEHTLFSWESLFQKSYEQNFINGRTDFLVKIIVLLRFLNRPYCYRNHHAKLEIVSNMYELTKNVNHYGHTDPNYRKALLFKRIAQFNQTNSQLHIFSLCAVKKGAHFGRFFFCNSTILAGLGLQVH